MIGIFLPVVVSGLTSGAIYALTAIGLSIVWGSMGMLNMAHAAMLALGGYAAFTAVTTFGLPMPLGIVAAFVAGGIAGAVLYVFIVRKLLQAASATFETNVLIATVGVNIALENALLMGYGGQPLKQPIESSGAVALGSGVIPQQNILIIAMGIALMIAIAVLLGHTRMGRAIRATAQNRDAAQLLGVAVSRVYLQVLVLSGMLAAVCGVLISSITQLTPSLGSDPMLKAFIMCVVAGLGNLPGAVMAAFGLALIEACVQYGAGGRWGFPVLLLIVIITLICRPTGLFGHAQIRRM